MNARPRWRDQARGAAGLMSRRWLTAWTVSGLGRARRSCSRGGSRGCSAPFQNCLTKLRSTSPVTAPAAGHRSPARANNDRIQLDRSPRNLLMTGSARVFDESYRLPGMGLLVCGGHEGDSIGEEGITLAIKGGGGPKPRDVVQVKNPRTDRYVKIDRNAGQILSHKSSAGPYKNVPVARKKK